MRGKFAIAALVLIVALGALRAWKPWRQVWLGVAVPPEQRVSLDRIDHTNWSRLLAEYVDPRGRVDYARWHRTPADIDALDAYLAELSRGDPARPGSRGGQLAYWINAYNAVTLRGMLGAYPTESIRNHTPEWNGYHIWYDLRLRVADRGYSLDEIEHEVLRPLGDPRIHFAIVCASKGCPRLLNRAYTAGNLETSLEENARAFFADPTKFVADARGRRLKLSWILSYFARDFGGDTPAVLARVAPYFPDEAARQMAADPATTVEYLPYDWSLNGS